VARARRPHVVGILLAAGRGERFGGDKLLARLPFALPDVPAGTPLAVAAARHLRTALPDSVAVVRARDARVAELLEQSGLRVIACERADEGMGASLACGVRGTVDADAWVVALADMPWIAPSTIAGVAQALRCGASIAAPACEGRRGHPVGFAAAWRSALLALGGDEGARRLVTHNPHEVVLVRTDDRGVLRDVDTPRDLEMPEA